MNIYVCGIRILHITLTVTNHSIPIKYSIATRNANISVRGSLLLCLPTTELISIGNELDAIDSNQFTQSRKPQQLNCIAPVAFTKLTSKKEKSHMGMCM